MTVRLPAVSAPAPAPTKLDDRMIRAALLQHLRKLHQADTAALIVEELGLCEGAARVDIAVVNGALEGFEIKSDCDTLARLPRQRQLYGLVLDSVTVVVGATQLSSTRRRVPRWWGIVCAVAEDDTSHHLDAFQATTQASVRLVPVRAAQRNPSPNAFALAQLLWRDEALAVLRRCGLAGGHDRASRRVLWKVLASHLSLDELRSEVRAAIKARGLSWRAREVSP